MHINDWIWLAFFAMAFSATKVIVVKTHCQSIPPSALMFHSRLFAAGLLLIPAALSTVEIHSHTTFWSATFAAAVITIVASVLYIKSIQLGDLVIVSPIQASIPVFMVITTYALYGEIPNEAGLVCLLLIVASIAYLLLKLQNHRPGQHSRALLYPALLSVAAAFLYGISTLLDRTAIAATDNGAIFYSAMWSLITLALLLGYMLKNRTLLVESLRQHYKGIGFYVTVSVLAFIFQQLAVQQSLDINSGVTYVKAIVMIHIGIAAMVGIFLLKEKITADIIFANAVAFAAGIGLVLNL
ncbi:MAG: DMT family transporter [Gammaproteobacteria bacterium]|nr:DMT family transporter [Gammaproteobacteria bacterium]